MASSHKEVNGLYKQSGSNNWFTKVKGVRQPTGTSDFAEAVRILRIRQGRTAEGQPIFKRVDQVTYDEAAEDLKRHYTTTRTRDLEEAGYRFQNLDAFFQGKKIKNVTPALVTHYVEKHQGEGAADKTINNEVEVLIKLLRLAFENNKLLRLPIIHKLKVNNVRQGFFEQEQFERVQSLLHPHHQLANVIAKTYGWRMQSEILTLEWRRWIFTQKLGRCVLIPALQKTMMGALCI